MANVAATFTANISGYTNAMKAMQDSTGKATSGIKSKLSSSGGAFSSWGHSSAWLPRWAQRQCLQSATAFAACTPN